MSRTSNPCARSRAARAKALLASCVSTLLVLLASCGGEHDGGKGEPGALSVRVRNDAGAAVRGAEVWTEPPTSRAVTDAAGAVLIADVVPGFYRVVARLRSDAASQAVALRSNEIARVVVTLDAASGPGAGGATAGGSESSAGEGGRGDSWEGGAGGDYAGEPGSPTSGRGGNAGANGGRAGGGGRNSAGRGAVDYIDAATQIEAMRVDPERPYLYALDRVNNSLHFINLETHLVEGSIFVGSSPVDLEISGDGAELYVANFGSSEIAVVDLETQEVGRTFFVDPSQGTWDGNPYRIALAGDTLVYTSQDQWCDLKLVDVANGGFMAAFGSLYAPDLVATADGQSLFVGESGGSLHRYTLEGSTLTAVDSSTAGGTRLVVLSGDERFVFYGGRKYQSANLKNVLGTFADTIQAANHDGSVAVGTRAIYDAEAFAILEPLAVTSTVVALSHDDRTLYLYELTSSRIHVIDIGAL